MSNHIIDLSGQKFGRLTVISKAGKTSNGNFKWLCRCDCGAIKEFASGALRSGTTISCGCWIREMTSKRSYTHGETKLRLHHIWAGMKARCNYEKAINYKDYGGRGIKVCEEWTNSYIAFRDWALSNGYNDSLSIDRIKSDGNYEPSNCRWATKIVQANNKRTNRTIIIDGVKNTVTEWGRIYKIDPQAIWARLNRGWDEMTAVITPSDQSHKGGLI